MAEDGASLDEKFPSSPTTVHTENAFVDGPSCETGGSGSVSEKRSWLHRFGLKREQNTEIVGITTRKLEACPNGYPRLGAFLSSEPSFMLYRSFDYLHSRVLLNLQDDIVILERELDKLDRFDDGNDKSSLLQSREKDLRTSSQGPSGRTRQQILAQVRTKLVEYDEVLIKARDLVSFQRPSKRDYSSVRTWFYNTSPIVEKEEQFIRHKEDIVTLRHGREWAGFDGFVESQLRRFNCSLVRWIFCTPELRCKTSDKDVYYYSSSRIESFVGLLITCIIFILLVLPVVAMYELTSFGTRTGVFDAIGVLIVFTLLFSAAMSLLTKAARHELFAASAAYCAVLVVFISNFGTSSIGY